MCTGYVPAFAYGIRAFGNLNCMPRHIPVLLGLFFIGCKESSPFRKDLSKQEQPIHINRTIGDIPLPEGYTRVNATEGSFAAWLRKLPLKKDKTVYLYDGRIKPNQTAQFAV